MDAKVKDIRGREMPALEIFTHAVKFMKNHLFNNLEGRGIKVDDFKIIWVLTVPAIWDDRSKSTPVVVQIQTPRRFSCRGTILLKELNIPSAQSKTEREKIFTGQVMVGRL